MKTNAMFHALRILVVDPANPSASVKGMTALASMIATAKETENVKGNVQRAGNAIGSAIATGHPNATVRMEDPLLEAEAEVAAVGVDIEAATQIRTQAAIGRWQSVWDCEMDLSF